MNFVSVISCAAWLLTVFTFLYMYTLLLLKIQCLVYVLFLFIHTVNSIFITLDLQAQINVDVVNFKEYIQIRVAKHIVFPSTSMTVSSE